MRQGFRPSLEPPNHRKAVVEARRPGLCLTLSLVVVLLVFAIFGVSAWNVYAHRFSANTQYFHTRDEVSLIQVNNDLSATFCQGYNVTHYGPAQVYLLPHQADVNTTFVDVSPIEMYQLPYRILNVKASYLLTGSSVDVTACLERGPPGPPARVVFIRGDSNFQNWRKNSNCRSCALKDINIYERDLCDRQHPRLNYKVHANDKYFLAIYYGRPIPDHHGTGAPIRVRGEFKRTHFDLSSAEQVCNTSSCIFDLPWASSKDVVVKFEGFDWESFRNVTTECEARIVFWVGLFGILPIVCVIPVSLLFGWFLCRRTRRNAKALRDKREKRMMQDKCSRDKSRPQVHVVTQEDYGSVAIQDG